MRQAIAAHDPNLHPCRKTVPGAYSFYEQRADDTARCISFNTVGRTKPDRPSNESNQLANRYASTSIPASRI